MIIRMRSKLILLLLTVSATQSWAGLKWIDVGVNGLTCSMCTRSVEMSLRRLDFVDSVVMSLETTEGRIFFKPNTPVNLNQLAKAVTNAGFSVRFLKLQITFDDIPLNSDGSFVFQGQPYQWLDFKDKVKGAVALKLVDESFLPKKESTEWKKKFVTLKPGNQKILHVVQQG
jgi:copper chaperone CopZ